MLSFQSAYFDDTPVPGRIVDVFTAREFRRDIGLFFVHGGGWKHGCRSIFHEIIHGYCQAGFHCASTDYRLGGTNVFGQVEDIALGLQIFSSRLKAASASPRVLVVGSSAGAHLSLLMAMTQASVLHLVAGVAVQSAPFTMVPWPDIFPVTQRALEGALGLPYAGNEAEFVRASPVTHIAPGQAPLFVMHADTEDMFPREQFEDFAARFRDAGNHVEEKTYPRTEHGFFYSLGRWQQQQAFEDVMSFAENLTTRKYHG